MEKHEMPDDSRLPRPVVLRPEDLANVAAAGLATMSASLATARILVAGGISVMNVTSVGQVAM